MLLVEQVVLRAIGRIFVLLRGDTDRYLEKVSQARRLPPWYWARLPVSRRDRLGDLHSALMGLGFLVLIVVNLLGVAVASWVSGPARVVLLAPLVVTGAVAYTHFFFHGVSRVRFIAHRDDWEFTLTRAPVAFALVFAAFLYYEIFLFLL